MSRSLRTTLLALACCATVTAAQQPAGVAAERPSAAPADPRPKKPLALADLARWSHIVGAAISSDGRWMASVVVSNAGDTTLAIRNLDSGVTTTVAGGSAPQFADDAAWVAYWISTPAARGGRGSGAAAPGAAASGRRVELLRLATGERHSVPNVASFAFTTGSRHLALKLNRAAGQATAGTTLLLRDLARGTDLPLGHVNFHAFDAGARHLAYTVDAPDRVGNGVYLLTLETGATTPLSTGASDYAGLAWHLSGRRLAALRGEKQRERRQRENALLVWSGVGTAELTLATFDPARDGGVPSGLVLSELATPQFNGDGTRIHLGVKEQEAEPARSEEARANVDVWHWKDDDVQTRQAVLLPQERRATHAAVYDLARRTLRVLGDSVMRGVTPAARGRWAVGRVDTAYHGAVDWFSFTSKGDYYRVDVESGERRLIDRGVNQSFGVSPDGRWFLYAKAGTAHAYDLDAGRGTRLDPAVDLANTEGVGGGSPSPIFGLAGWSRDGRGVILDGRYDVYAFPLDGSRAVALTGGVGERERIRFRLTPLGRRGDGEPGIDLSAPMVLSATGEWTKQSGYWRLEPGRRPVPLLFVDKRVSGAQQASRADRVIFTQQTATEFPDYWVSDATFATPRRVTDANPVLAEFAWTPKRVLVEYENRAGRRLQGTLTLPAGYEPGRRYPMVVFIYERVSDQHHDFQTPALDHTLGVAAYASNGYLVLQPDIVYETGKPGTSAADCVTSAVRRTIALGYADPRRVGLYGRSLGGYEAAFITTQTDAFAAAVVGAPYANLVSMYSTIYKSLGLMVQGAMEVGQMRMGENVTPWNALARYESQSPIHHLTRVRTPILVAHGTADGAVDFTQALEYYGALRRLGKPAILLSYPDEGHHLARRENQLDFQTRMKQYFDHHLTGAPAPRWMTHGVPQARKGEPPS